MEQVTIWYQTDNDNGKSMAQAIQSLGITTNIVERKDFSQANIVEDDINVFIFDLEKKTAQSILDEIDADRRIQSFLKFVILKKKDIQEMLKESYNYIHLEYISRPIEKREFLLLVEKSIIVERYREMMKYVSKEAESRIESYEELMDINRKNVFESDTERNAFENILKFEKNLMEEQARLSKAIRAFTVLRQNEIFDMKNRIKAEELLGSLREKELRDANQVIGAQENVLNHSAHELYNAKEIITATEQVVELSRHEAIDLHDQLEKERELNRSLSEEIERLITEVEDLKQEQNS